VLHGLAPSEAEECRHLQAPSRYILKVRELMRTAAVLPEWARRTR
jgi:hypothetical protein